MITRYIGSVPPPYGGVTIKNNLILTLISEKIRIKRPFRVTWLPGNVNQLINFLLALLSNQKLIIGISSVGGKSRTLTKMLYFCNRKSMNRSIYFMMGGQECFRIAKSERECKWYSQYKRIYVETKSMQKCLDEVGLRNVAVFPNCRKRPNMPICVQKDSEIMKCVFFSQISKQKGVDNILEAAARLPYVQFYFYGPIEADYESNFLEEVKHHSNVYYLGIFEGIGDSVYQELSKYDVLLFPTKYHSEGVPGILVEAKMAGIAIVASKNSYNVELVQHEKEGLILKHNTSDELVLALETLHNDRNMLHSLKNGSLDSAKAYYIEEYIQKILEDLEGIGESNFDKDEEHSSNGILL